MRCRKDRWKKANWKRNGIEEVKEYKYLGYMIKFNGR